MWDKIEQKTSDDEIVILWASLYNRALRAFSENNYIYIYLERERERMKGREDCCKWCTQQIYTIHICVEGVGEMGGGKSRLNYGSTIVVLLRRGHQKQVLSRTAHLAFQKGTLRIHSQRTTQTFYKRFKPAGKLCFGSQMERWKFPPFFGGGAAFCLLFCLNINLFVRAKIHHVDRCYTLPAVMASSSEEIWNSLLYSNMHESCSILHFSIKCKCLVSS